MPQDDICQTIHSKFLIKNSNAPHNVYHWVWHTRYHGKIPAASDTESDYAIWCTWVLSLHVSWMRIVHV